MYLESTHASYRLLKEDQHDEKPERMNWKCTLLLLRMLVSLFFYSQAGLLLLLLLDGRSPILSGRCGKRIYWEIYWAGKRDWLAESDMMSRKTADKSRASWSPPPSLPPKRSCRKAASTFHLSLTIPREDAVASHKLHWRAIPPLGNPSFEVKDAKDHQKGYNPFLFMIPAKKTRKKKDQSCYIFQELD